MGLTPRLAAVLSYIDPCEILADIGTDHGYLPIEAIKKGICKQAIAADINQGPVHTAIKNIAVAGLSSDINARLGGGLTPIQLAEIDHVTICGMGGMLIWRILSENKESMNKARHAKNLILQPQHDLEELRRNLHGAGFFIADEKLVREGQRFYTIIKTRYTGQNEQWTDKEYYLGKYFLQNKSEIFAQYLHQQKEKIEKYLANASATKLQQLEWIKGELS